MKKIVTFSSEGGLNMLITEVAGKQFLFHFEGVDIPGVAKIRSEVRYKPGQRRNWEVEILLDEVDGFVWPKDPYSLSVLGKSWQATIEAVNKAANKAAKHPHQISKETVQRFVRAVFGKKVGYDLDCFDEAAIGDPSRLTELFKSQERECVAATVK